jgi:signal peptidase I/conjugal transfer pilin signal peptidase TrbI
MVRNLNRARLTYYFPLLKKPDREVASRALMLLAAFLFGLFIPSRFSVTMTPSLVHRIYLISRITDAREIKKDSYVLFTLRNKYMRNGQPVDVMSTVVLREKHANGKPSLPAPVMKIARCIPGEYLRVEDGRYYCNSEYLGTAKEYSLRGEKVEHFVYDGIVPEGKLFVMGEHRDSFDSRYFGFIEVTDVTAIGHAVW